MVGEQRIRTSTLRGTGCTVRPRLHAVILAIVGNGGFEPHAEATGLQPAGFTPGPPIRCPQVSREGLEPSFPCGNQPLRLARLPFHHLDILNIEPVISKN